MSSSKFNIPGKFFVLGPKKKSKIVEDKEYFGHREFLLFALRTRISPEIKSILGIPVFIDFVGYPGSEISINLPGGKDLYLNDELRKEIQEVIDENVEFPDAKKLECLMLRCDSTHYISNSMFLDGGFQRIPPKWIRSVLPFLHSLIEIPKELQIRYDSQECGIFVGGLLEHKETNYKTVYNEISSNIIDALMKLWSEGGIVDVPQDMVDKWDLEMISKVKVNDNTTTLYSPSLDTKWGNLCTKLSDMPVSAFLYDLMKGSERQVPVKVGINLVDYHYIAKEVNGNTLAHFSNGSLYFTPKSAKHLSEIVNGVERVKWGGQYYGSVICFYSTRLSWIRAYSLIVRRSVSNDLVLYVRRDYTLPVFVLSVGSIPMDVDTTTLRQEILLRTRRLLLFLKHKMILPGENEDIHSILDDVNSKLPDDVSSPTVRDHVDNRKEFSEFSYPEHNIQF